LGLRPGDELLEINGHPLRDLIDVQFYGVEDRLTLRVRREGGERTLRARRRYDEPLGLDFVRPLFDADIRRCNNHCEFCFVAQMPRGLRPSLYIKDDDYRYSFLFGSYITLTNLTEEDWARIGEQHLTPLYVSVHATDPDLRRRVLGNPHAPDVIDGLRHLARRGIEVHTQLVLIPGLNDSPHLDRSIGDLADLYPSVRSVSVVPVGLTKYHRGGCRPYTVQKMREVWEQVTAWQQRLRRRLGVRFVYLSDEWYLRLGEAIPPRAAYDGLDLRENGVGLVRSLLDRWRSVERTLSALGGPGQTWVSGELMAPVLEGLAAKFADRTGIRAEVVPVPNRFFGETVTVAGLLTGQDVIAYLRERPLQEQVVLPAVMFRGPEGQSLDEMRPDDLARALERPVFLVD
jgi:putative radical SAM enzyme (TIGR03279 family)